jgi:hypothetical protein
MEVGKNSVIYMGLVPGPNKEDNICGKTKVIGTMQRGSTVLLMKQLHAYSHLQQTLLPHTPSYSSMAFVKMTPVVHLTPWG